MDHWSLIWTAVGGIAQAAAAIATFLAVGVALWLGIREGRRSLQARYDDARPVLQVDPDTTSRALPRVPKVSIPVQQENGLYLDWTQIQFSIKVQNVGNGPAFNVRSVIYGPEAIALPDSPLMPDGVNWKYLSDEKEKEEREKHWYHWTLDAVRQGEDNRSLEYVLAGQQPLRVNSFAEVNKHIESKDHKQKYSFNAPKHPLSPPTQKEPRCICRVTITYDDIFHRKHASIYDLIFRQGWQVVALLDDVISDLGDLVE